MAWRQHSISGAKALSDPLNSCIDFEVIVRSWLVHLRTVYGPVTVCSRLRSDERSSRLEPGHLLGALGDASTAAGAGLAQKHPPDRVRSTISLYQSPSIISCRCSPSAALLMAGATKTIIATCDSIKLLADQVMGYIQCCPVQCEANPMHSKPYKAFPTSNTRPHQGTPSKHQTPL